MAIAAIAAIVASMSVARAQTEEPPRDINGNIVPDDVRAEGRRQIEECSAHHDAERYAVAAECWTALYDWMVEHALPRAPVSWWNAGTALVHVPGRERDARAMLQRFLDESTAIAQGEEGQDVRGWRSEAIELIAELDARLGASEEETSNEGQPAESMHETPPRAMSPAGPVVLGIGIATIAVAGVLGAIALVRESDLENRCGGTTCPDTIENRSFYDETRAMGVATDVLLVVGALTAITGTVLLFTLTEGGGTEATTSARAVLRPGGAELALGGSF